MNLPDPGQPGNPHGKPKHQLWREALNRALHDKRDDGTGRKVKTIVLVAQSLVREALNGQRWAHEMIADRIDGPLLKQEAASGGVTVIVNRRGDVAVALEAPTIEGEIA